MPRKKTDRPTWAGVKAAISGFDRSELVKLIGDLYRLSKTNKDFLHARFAIGKDPLDTYRRTIEESMYPDLGKPIRISQAKRAISECSKAMGDSISETELMVFFVECGNRFTLDYGDIDEEFYDALVRMYERAIGKVHSLPAEEQLGFRARLRNIMTSSSGMGWGYHDGLCDLYYDAFPDSD